MSAYSASAAATSLVALHMALFLSASMPPATAAASNATADGATTTTSSLSRTPTRFPALFTFGDSIFDTGNNNVLPTPGKCDYPPYGTDFPLQKATGRCSNGRLPPDMIASTLGIKELLPPYLTTTSSDELLTGVSFASIGTGFDPLTAKLELMQTAMPISQQLDLFREYKEKIAAIAGKDKANSIVSNSLYIFCAGGNDVVTYFLAPFRKARYDVSSYAAVLVGYASDAIQEVYDLGARKIGVIGIPPVGCVPTARNVAGDSMRGCASSYNTLCVQYNILLSKELERLQKDLHDANTVFIDFYSSTLDIIQRPSAYGFKEVATGCCSTGPNDMPILCNSWTLCQDDSQYVFWDNIHPTEKTYRLIMREFKNKYLPLF